MRIWAFPSFYPYSAPGHKWLGIFAHRQYKGLIEAGAELYVVQPVLWYPGAPLSRLNSDWQRLFTLGYPKERIYDGIKVYHPRINNFKPNRFVKKTYSERYTDAIVDFFRKNKIKLDRSTDIFYAQWIPDAAFVQVAAHKLGIRSAILGIGDDMAIWPRSRADHLQLFKETLNNADVLLTVSGRLAAEAKKIAGKDLPFHIVRRGADHAAFLPAKPGEQSALREKFAIPQDKLVLLMIGSAIQRKGWLDLFDAITEIKKTNDQFVLVSVHSGYSELNISEEVRSRGLTGNVIEIGETEPSKMNELYKTADIFCLPSHSEGIANAVVEAMSSGLPVLTTDVGSHSDLVEDGYNGLLIPPSEPAILLRRLKELMDDKALRSSLGENARSFIVNKWGSFADNAKILYHILEDAQAIKKQS